VVAADVKRKVRVGTEGRDMSSQVLLGVEGPAAPPAERPAFLVAKR